eukprot:403359521
MSDTQVSQQTQQKLRSMNKQQLLEFLKKKGIQGKAEHTIATKHVTQDHEDVEDMTDKLVYRISHKKRKIEQLESQRKNFEMEVAGLDVAISALKDKIKKREDQRNTAEGNVKRQKDELKRIQREVTPKLVKQLYNMLEKKTPEKVCRMLEAFVGLIRNSESSNNQDVEVYLEKHEGLLYKMQRVKAEEVKENVINKHFNTIKNIQKSFIDSTDPDYLQCSPYAAFIAWASQFVILCKDTQFHQKCLAALASVNRDIESKKLKRETQQAILDNFNKDGYITFLEKEVSEEEQRIQDYQRLDAKLRNKAAEDQQKLYGYEKEFFQNLEQAVINKKQARR